METEKCEDFEFLRLVAKAYVENEHDLTKFSFIFPNRRSMKFFQKYLGQEYGKIHKQPLISPQLITINELFIQLSGLQQIDNIEALYILYNFYIKLKYTKLEYSQAIEQESFDDFVHWGDIILRDFDDVDKYLADAKQLFTNIKDLKDLDSDYSFLSQAQKDAIESFWSNFLKGEFTEKKEMFASMWNIMFTLYTYFKEAISDKKLAYEGQMYRHVAENIIAGSNVDTNLGTLVFIGLNAPNKCERVLMKYLQQNNRAHFYWDFYGPMITDKENSASEIISELVSNYPPHYIINNNFERENAKKDISVIGIASGVGQAFVVSSILKDLEINNTVSKEQAFRTCVLLPDEKLLIPVLNSIPQEYSSINVTMGYPMSSTTLISFMNLISQLQRDVRNIDGVPHFYHKSVLELLNHSYIIKLEQDRANEIKNNIVSANRIFISHKDSLLSSQDYPLLKLIFSPLNDISQVIDYQKDILRYLNECLDSLEKEFIYQYYLRINRLKELNIPMEIKTYFKLLSKLTSSITVPFRGEPLQGLQIMGTLEIRALDFDNLIICSVNEGVFPTSVNNNSLIPYNLRYGFGMPTYELQDGIAAYHFYRSICRAKKVFLIYDTRSEGLNSGELSRYVKQLKYHFNLNIEQRTVAYNPIIKTSNKVEVVKDEQIMRLLYDKYLYSDNNFKDKKALSASSINNYLTCSLKFYFENVKNIKEQEQVSEKLENDTFGTLFHNTLEQFYKKYEGEIISKEILESSIKNTGNIDKIIEEQFFEILKINKISGQNITTRELIKKYVKLSLSNDINYTPFTYLLGEKFYLHPFEILNSSYKVNFKAFIDRMDIVHGRLRIIDYKTGSVEKFPSAIDPTEMFNRDNEGKYKALLQLFIYAMIVVGQKQNTYKEENIDLLIYPIKKIATESPFSISLLPDNLAIFEDCLRKTIEEIFNPDIPFIANKGCKTCNYCKFINLCGK